MTARVHDVGIGLAVAWARERTKYRIKPHMVAWDDGVIIGGPSSNFGFVTCVDRGPVVEPEPLQDHRVAFGIALAQRGPWRSSFRQCWGNDRGLSFSCFWPFAAVQSTSWVEALDLRIRPDTCP